jgi:hypothetical protein
MLATDSHRSARIGRPAFGRSLELNLDELIAITPVLIRAIRGKKGQTKLERS